MLSLLLCWGITNPPVLIGRTFFYGGFQIRRDAWRSIRHDEEWHIEPFWGMLWFWGIILHGALAFLPNGRKTYIYQRIIGSLICYYECAGTYGSVGSGIIQPIIAATICNLVAWCQHSDG